MSKLNIITDQLLTNLSTQASLSPRLRKNHNLHPSLDDPVQRLCNAFEPGTYVQPHRHTEVGRWELFVVLRGTAAVLIFDDQGSVLDRVELEAEGEIRGVEVPSNTWHTIVSLMPGTVLFEVKPGPYIKTTDKDFANWAPPEGDSRCSLFEKWYLQAQKGECPAFLNEESGSKLS
ncbi:MAG: WbuC family cupin fold metalloprotein [Arenicellales bacterium]|nr:WbuC family cupin fold metalloprotein [Arenicellales bacterium]